jgi:hypothetical protein
MTEEERTARITAGAKWQSRPRLGQSGPLTGKQYSVRQAYTQPAAANARSTKIRFQVHPPQEVTRPTWGTHRSRTVVAPGPSRRASRWGGLSSLPVRAAFPPPVPHRGLERPVPQQTGMSALREWRPCWKAWRGVQNRTRQSTPPLEGRRTGQRQELGPEASEAPVKHSVRGFWPSRRGTAWSGATGAGPASSVSSGAAFGRLPVSSSSGRLAPGTAALEIHQPSLKL